MPYVQQRRGTASALASANEIPLAGQIVVETDTGKVKIGNGTTTYSGLEYVTDVSNIADATITTAKMADGAIHTAKMADAGITTAKLADSSVTTAKIADNAVTSAKVPDGSVSTAKLADDAVTFAKMQDVSANSLLGAASAGGVTQIVCRQIGRDILDDSTAADVRATIQAAPTVIDTTSLADDAVTYAKMQNVGAEKVLGNSTTSSGNVEELPSTTFGRSLLNSASSSALASTLGVATTSDITAAIDNLIDTAPGALNTLNELAAAVADDASFSTTVTNSIATKLPLAGGSITGDVDMQRSASSKTKFDWGNSNGSGNFSSTADDFDYIRLYTSGTTYAGMGITTSNFNIGTTGLVNLTVRTDGSVRTQYTSSGESHHYGLHKFDAPFFVSAGNTPTGPKVSCVTDTNTGIYFPAADQMAVSCGGAKQLLITGSALEVSSGSVYAPLYRVNGSSSVAGSTSLVAVGQTGDNDTGIYFPAADEVSISSGGQRRLNLTSTITYFDRAGNNPTIKASTAASGYMIIDSNSTSPISLNHYSNNDVWLNYNSTGNGGSTLVAPPSTSSTAGTHKLRVFGTSLADAMYVADGTGTAPAVAFSNDTNTGIYRVAADRIGIVTGGATRFQIDSQGAVAFGTAPVSGTSHYATYNSVSKTEKTSLQGSVNDVTHAVTNGSAVYATIGVNGSAYKTITADNVTENGSSYVRGGHFTASTRTQTGCTSSQSIGVYSVAQHLYSTAGTSQLVGGQFLCYQSSPGSTASTTYGVFARCSITSAADANSAITNAYALYSDVTRANGTITNGYGLLIGDINATNKYGVYQLDTEATNVFQGKTQFKSTSGSAGSYLPGISFIGDGNTGIGRTVADVVDVVCGGNIVGDFRTTGIRMINGTSSECAYAFREDADTGMFRDTSTGLNLQFAGSGLQIHSAHINAEKKIFVPTGSQQYPSIAQAGNDNTGISFGSVGADQINLNAGGNAKVSINPTATYFAGLVQFSGTITDGTTTKTAAQLMAKIAESPPPSGYGLNLLFG